MVLQLYTSPPPHRTSLDDRPTLLVTYWCSACCLLMIVWRLIGRLLRMNQLYSDDKLMAVTIVPLVVRQLMVHFVIVYGTNNVDARGLGEDEVLRREMGSRYLMGARVAYTTFVWSQKLCIAEFYSKMTNPFWEKWQKFALKWFKIYLGASFVATVISLLAECQPFEQNFQVLPPAPAHCRQAISFLLTHSTTLFPTDAFLALFPLPIILYSRLTTTRKLCLLFALSASLLPLGLAAAKIPIVLRTHAAQPLRTLLASFEGLLACAIANLVVLLSFVRDTAPKRQKFRTESDAEKSLRPAHPPGRRGSVPHGAGALPDRKRFSATSTDGTASAAPRGGDWWSTHDGDLSDSDDDLEEADEGSLKPTPLRPALTLGGIPPPPPSSAFSNGQGIPPPSPAAVTTPTSLYPGHNRRWSGGNGADLVSSFMPVPGVGYGYSGNVGRGEFGEFERRWGGWGKPT